MNWSYTVMSIKDNDKTLLQKIKKAYGKARKNERNKEAFLFRLDSISCEIAQGLGLYLEREEGSDGLNFTYKDF